VERADAPDDACRDPGDLVVLGTAKAANARYLISGGRDLLALESCEGISIVNPRQFWDAQAKEISE
jgi:predicted nucleic acid-binding protein